MGKEQIWMKIRSAGGGVSAGALALLLALGAAGCGKDDDNTNNTNAALLSAAPAVAATTSSPTSAITKIFVRIPIASLPKGSALAGNALVSRPRRGPSTRRGGR